MLLICDNTEPPHKCIHYTRSIFDLPSEIFVTITSFLNWTDLYMISRVCKNLQKMVQANILWEPYCKIAGLVPDEHEKISKFLQRQRAWTQWEEESQDPEMTVRLLIVGDRFVGKTAIFHRFMEDKFEAGHRTESEFKFKRVKFREKYLRLMLSDYPDRLRFRTISSTSCYRRSHGILIVYDTTDKTSLDHFTEQMRDIKRYAPPDVNLIMVGAKADRINEKQVDISYIQSITAKYGDIKTIEVSSKLGVNINEAFRILVGDVFDRITLQLPMLQHTNSVIKIRGTRRHSNKCTIV